MHSHQWSSSNQHVSPTSSRLVNPHLLNADRFISLGVYGIFYSLTSRRLWIPAALLWILQYAGFALYVVFRGFPSPVSLALGIATTPSLIHLFVLGLVA